MILTATIAFCSLQCILADQSEPPKAPPATKATVATPVANHGKYFLVPLQGTFGKEITAPGVAQAFKIAKQKGAGTIVFEIDSPGGSVSDADAIVKVIDETKSDMKVVTVVKRAISASIWILAHSDVIAFEPGGPAGAAVCFSIDPKSGNAEVDAKLNAAYAAELAAAAEARGQPGAIYRAMVLQSVELFQHEDAGQIVLSNEPINGMKASPTRLDDRETVLALTPNQAVRMGFGTKISNLADTEMAKLVGATSWEAVAPASNGRASIKFGADAVAFEERALTRAEQSLQDSNSKYKASQAEVTRLIERAQSMGSTHIPTYYGPSGNYTSDSQTRWRNHCDSAIEAWQRVLDELRHVSSLQKQIVSHVAEINWQMRKVERVRKLAESTNSIEAPDFSADNIELDRRWKNADDALADLRLRRNRTRN